MKTLMALILAGSLLLAGCAKKEVTSDEAFTEPPPAPAQEAPVAIEPEPEPVVVAEPEPVVERGADKIFFEFNSHELTPASQKALEDNALWLEAEPQLQVVIEGYADERGSDAYNMNLGKKRAKAARDYLVARGVAPERITVVSYGEKKATHGAADDAVWALDRRAEFVTAN